MLELDKQFIIPAPKTPAARGGLKKREGVFVIDGIYCFY